MFSFRLCLVGCKIFSGKENIFKCLVAFQKLFWKIFSGIWLYSWKYSRKPIFIMFLTFFHVSHIFSHFLSFQTNISSNLTKPKFSIPNKKKKIIKSEINPKLENNKTRTTHATTTTTRKSKRASESKTRSTQRRIDPEQANRRFGGTISGLTNGATISGFTTIGGEWVWWFLGSRRSVTNGFDNF